MAWTEITRRQYRREGLRYASDLTDAEWGLLKPSSLMVVMRGTRCGMLSQRSENGRSRSSSDPTMLRASRFYRAGGSSSVHSRGLVDAAGSPRILKRPSQAQPRGCWSPTSEPSHGGWQDLDLVHVISRSDSKTPGACDAPALKYIGRHAV